MSATNYRPDIDGLRSIAVLLVVIFHAGFNFIPGGFIGVDVFFVLSGYLITTILYREISNKSFTYANFYKRRIRRLLPALFAVLAVSSVAAIFILLPDDLVSYAKSLLFTVFSISNMYFWKANGGYFEGNAQEVPLLHTWSLSVEEQFYFIWPAIIMFGLRLVGIRWLLVLMVIALVVAAGLSEWAANITFGAAYYLLPTRMFELMIGALLALSWQHLPNPVRLASHGLSLIGMTLIIGSAILLTESDTFPGFNALYATVGTALLIYSGKGTQPGIINQLLSFRPFVAIGLISYSLYLWHWPIIVYARLLGFELGGVTSLILIGLSIGFAWATYQWVEKPFRHARGTQFKETFLKLFTAPVVATLMICALTISFAGFPGRFSPQIIEQERALASLPSELRENKGCHARNRNYKDQPSENCWFGDINSRKTAFFYGDSHSNHFNGFVDVLALDAGIKVQDYTLDACIPIMDLYWGHNDHFAETCKARNEFAKNHILANNFDYVVLAGNWPSDTGFRIVHQSGHAIATVEEMEAIILKQLKYTLSIIEDTGAIPVIILKAAPSGSISAKCPMIKSRFNSELECDLPREIADKRNRAMLSIVAKAKIDYPNLRVVDPLPIMCDDELCHAEVTGIPVYIDSNHLNDKSSRAIAEQFLKAFPNPFNQVEVVAEGELK